MTALSALAPAAAPAQAPLERALAGAERAAQAGQARRAWTLWRRVAARYPEDERAASRMAAELPRAPEALATPSDTLLARAAEAERALEAHLAATAEPSASARRLHAWSLAARDHARAVERAAEAAGLQDAEAAALLARLAALSVLRGDLRAARRALEAAHAAMPQASVHLSDLAAVELALGEPEAAATRFARVLARDPGDLGARRDLAGALVAAGRAGEAVALLEEAAARHPEEPELAIELARAALEAGQPRAAERAARAAIAALADTDPRGHAVLGAALAARGRREEAELAFGEALRRDPRDLRARHGLDALRAPPEAPPEPDAGRRLAPP